MKDSITLKHKFVRDFTILPNHLLRDTMLSWGATGLLAYLMHLPDDFRLYLFNLAKQKRDGRDATRARIKELEATGYLKVSRVRDERGQFTNTTWEINPLANTPSHTGLAPGTDNPTLDNPTEGDPAQEDPTLLNTKLKQELKEKRTTTTNGPVDKSHKDLYYPPGLLINEPQALYRSLLDIPVDDAQKLLDEVTGVMEIPGGLKTTPVRFLHGLLKKYRSGHFMPSAGLKVMKRRENK